MTRRRLNPDELELWRKVARTAERMHPDRAITDTPLPKPKPQKTPHPRHEHFQIGQKANGHSRSHDVLPGLTDRHAVAPVRMDTKTFGRLKRGKLVPEGKIDLHGKTLDQAHGALTGFIMRAHGQGKRLVLVVTGKGKQGDDHGPIPQRVGILRHNVPHWLQVPPLAQMVLQVSEAHGRHGGGGAYYVYLRRKRQ